MKNKFKIRGGGIGAVLVTFVIIFLWFIFAMSLKQTPIKQLIEGPIKSQISLIGFLCVCIYCSIIAFKYLTCNFIEIIEDELRISVSDYGNFRRSWPKYNKQNIKLDNIGLVHLISLGKFLPPVLMIQRKDAEPYQVNTKPFTKSAFRKLFKEFEKRGIKVEIEEGAI